MMTFADKKRLLLLIPLSALLLLLLMEPQTVYQAALRGLGLWWRMIAPALLPFFIVSELVLELGLAALLAPALSKLMRPLFNLPGAAALPVLMGFCSGFPTGAIITARLRREQALSAAEAARLVAFTNNAGPLYITISVAAGLLRCPQAAWVLAIAHYGGNLLLGMALGWSARRQGAAKAAPPLPKQSLPGYNSLGRALKKSAQEAANNILLVGCYMVFFSVITALLEAPLSSLRPVLHALAQGCWEMSLGIDLLAAAPLPLTETLPMAAAILALGGLSVQAQVLAMIADTDISPRIYLLCRLAHALLSYAAAGWLCRFINEPTTAAAALSPPPPVAIWPSAWLLCAGALSLWLLAGCAAAKYGANRGF